VKAELTVYSIYIIIQVEHLSVIRCVHSMYTNNDSL
jgi:hypothetical protein